MPKRRRIVLVEFKNWMVKTGRRQNDIASALDVSPAFLSRCLYGDDSMPTDKIDLLWSKFRVPKRWFSRAA